MRLRQHEFAFAACLIIYVLIAWALAITTGSWMVNIINTASWSNVLEKSQIGESITTQILEKSWSRNPFVEVYPTTEVSCPANYSDELIYDIWPGTRAMCDCL